MAGTQDPVLSAQIFAAGLDLPLEPSLCPPCFTIFASAIEADEPVVPLLMKKSHAFWNALMIFVSSDWTPERQDAATRHLLRASIRCVSCSLLEGALINDKNRYKGFGKKPQRWPTSADQLFPRGFKRTVAALISQLRSHCCAQALLERLIHFHRHIVFPILMEPDNRALVIDCVITRLAACVSRATTALDRLRPGVPGPRLGILSELAMTSEPTAGLLFIILCDSTSQVDERLRFCHRHEAELFSALHAVVSLIHGGGSNLLFTHLASQLWCLLSESQREVVGCVSPPEYATGIESLEMLDNPYRVLEYYLSLRPSRRDCSGPECDERAPTPLSRCARCRTVQYCSRACQKADWRGGAPTPHKDICDLLRELGTFARTDRSMGPDMFVAACVEHAFPLEHVDTIISWATHGNASTHYATGEESKHHMHDPLIVVEKTNCTPSGGFEFSVKLPAFAKGRDVTEEDLLETAEKVKEAMKAEGASHSRINEETAGGDRGLGANESACLPSRRPFNEPIDAIERKRMCAARLCKDIVGDLERRERQQLPQHVADLLVRKLGVRPVGALAVARAVLHGATLAAARERARGLLVVDLLGAAGSVAVSTFHPLREEVAQGERHLSTSESLAPCLGKRAPEVSCEMGEQFVRVIGRFHVTEEFVQSFEDLGLVWGHEVPLVIRHAVGPESEYVKQEKARVVWSHMSQRDGVPYSRNDRRTQPGDIGTDS
ncbi:hypothetical protein AURDEDRAFT_130597 [Auricularia subglabra TFB-10046 SS5]|uniref:MYND-type domain-containing protein n=1 Tax=Auricularia subglabra (strain TFB-10046 / SS5) TaxID=717982 RepID=J0WTC9_AURST|nr:hypothetical protein AURDEDRAFT_130597 [Auricularia subglabra TFB-10046 SS5]